MNKMLLLFLLFLTGCTAMRDEEKLIKKNLDSRYTRFEIVEIRPDSSNVYDVINTIRSLLIRTSSNNLEIIKLLNEFDNATMSSLKKRIYFKIDSLYTTNKESILKFEDLRFDKSEACFRVEYLVHNGERKVRNIEFFYINPYNKEVLTRPYEWEEFMRERNYDKVIKEALRYQKDILEIKWKYGL